jgi:hypothetical protein
LGTYKGTTSEHTSVKLVVVNSGARGCTGLCVVSATDTGIYITLKCKASPGTQPVTAGVPFVTYGAKIKPDLKVLVRQATKHPTYTAPNWTVSMSFSGHGSVTGKLAAKGAYEGAGSPVPCTGNETFSAKLVR